MPLLELFSMCDDTFTEDEALTREHAQITAGRIYEQWKKTRSSLDPDFDPANFERRARSFQRVPAKQTFFTATTPTLEKNRKKKSSSGSGRRNRSANNVK
jgi:hypothetical protein